MLTEKFSKALIEVESLNEIEQNNLATLIQEEIKWSISFSNTQDLLTILADEAIKDFKNGKTKEIDCE